jgi:serpin B
MNLRRVFPLAFSLALAASACSSDDTQGPAPECTDPSTAGCMVASSKQRVTSPDVPDADLSAAVAGNTDFATALYQQLRTEPGNLFYSPFSISEALAMAWAGANGETAAEMASALHFTLPEAQLHPAFNAIDLALMSRGEGKAGADGGKFRLNIANALWGQMGYSFQTPFLDTLAVNYGAGMHVVDFEKAAEPSRVVINDWVAERTEDRIKDLLPKGSIDSATRLVLTNAIYFNAAWETPFKAESTKERAFTLRDGTTVNLPTMSGYQDTGYGEGDGWAALDMPYDGHELSMVLVLPAAGTLDAFEASLSSARIDEIIGAMGHYSVDVTLPKFKIESAFSLKAQLSKMGMPLAFSDAADFSRIDGKGGLMIGDVVHKAFVNVNEAGTEAAAATGVTFGATSVPLPAEIHFDRPFLFFIRDIATKSVLFVGRVEDPRG